MLAGYHTKPNEGENGCYPSVACPKLLVRERYIYHTHRQWSGSLAAHPEQVLTEDDDHYGEPGAELAVFERKWKLVRGFIYLRTLRTGRRALSLERGSLLDKSVDSQKRASTSSLLRKKPN